MKKLMFSVLLCCPFLYMAIAQESEITKALIKYHVIPDLLYAGIQETLNVTFENNVVVNMGNEIRGIQTRNQPAVNWIADENAFYTIMHIDPDAPRADYPVNKNLNLWMVGNIPGKNIRAGEVLYEYLPAATPRGGGFNRYVFLLYKQPYGEIYFDEKRLDKFTFEGRPHFSPQRFASKYELGNPVAANFYRAQYDPFTLVVYNQVQCCFEFNSP